MIAEPHRQPDGELSPAPDQAGAASDARDRGSALAALAALSTRLAEALSAEDIADVVVAQAARTLGAQRGVVALLDARDRVLEMAGSVDMPSDAMAVISRMPLDASFPIAHAARTGETVYVESPAEMAHRFPAGSALLAPLGVQATVSAPAFAGGALRGAIAFGFDEPRHFDEAGRHFVTAVAAQCAQAIERLQLRRTERVAADRTFRLQRVTAALSHALSPGEVAEVILREGLAALGTGAGSVLRLSDDGHEYVLLRTVGYPADWIRPYERFPVSAPVPVRDVYETREPVFLTSAAEWERRYGALPASHLDGSAAPNGAWAALPMLADGRLVGAIALSFATRRDFDDEERGFMLALAHQCAQALERARLYDEAVAANQAKAHFLAVMSHELRTPLTAVLGYMELVMDEVLGPVTAAQREHLQRARASGEHLLILVEDLLSFARLEAGRDATRLEALPLAAVLEEAVSLVAPLAARKQLPVQLEDRARTTITTDRQKLRQILVNLLANAVKFTDQGTVRLTAWASDEDVWVAVTDTGGGILPENLERVFDPFWQVDQARTRRVSGTGLGLSVARQFARLLGGDLTAESEPGRGSTFTVRLPRLPEPVPASA